MIRGVSRETLLHITQYQLFSLLEAAADDDEMRWRMAGAEIPEPPKVATLQDLMAFGL